MKNILALIAALFFCATASATQLSDPSDFSPNWESVVDQSCVAKNGQALRYRLFTKKANDGILKIFVTVDAGGVRKVQMRELELNGFLLGIQIEVQKGDEILLFKDHRSADNALIEAFGMSRTDFRQCFGK